MHLHLCVIQIGNVHVKLQSNQPVVFFPGQGLAFLAPEYTLRREKNSGFGLEILGLKKPKIVLREKANFLKVNEGQFRFEQYKQ